MQIESDLFGARPAPPSKVAAAPVGQRIHELAERLPRNLRFGTSTWSFAGWRGIVYAAEHEERVLAREGLTAYAQHPLLRAVGVDRSYYAPLTVPTLERMRAAVSADFRFLLKAHAALTWPKSLSRPDYLRDTPDVFLDAEYARRWVIDPAVAVLGERLGTVLFQFPPLGPRVLRWRSELLARLSSFLRELPRDLPPQMRYAVEWRDGEMLGEDYHAVLAEHGVVHGYAAHPRLPAITSQTSCELARHAEPAPLVIRWLLHPTRTYEGAKAAYAPFDRLIDADVQTRAQIVELARSALDRGQPVTVIVNNKAEGSAPLGILALAEAFAAAPKSKASE